MHLGFVVICLVVHWSVPVFASNGLRTLEEDKYAFRDLTEMKRQTLQLLDLIYNRYEIYDPYVSMFWHLASNMGGQTWDIFKYKWATKLMSKEDTSYFMIFAGSSVTAGHDNKRNNSFPSIVEKRLNDVLAAGGIKLTMNNIAQGANPCIPYGYCYESMAGLDPDFIAWEQSYNCGHDTASFELTSRIAGFSKNHGIVYFSSSGAFKPGSCKPSNFTPPYSDESWTPDTVSDYKKWTPNKADIAAYKTKLNWWWEGGSSGQRYSGYKGSGYNSVGRLGFNVWQVNLHCNIAANISWNGKDLKYCDAFSVVANTASCNKMRFMAKEAARYGSDNGGGAKHHPTKAFHMLRGEAIVWLHALTLLDAIYMIEEDQKKNGMTPPLMHADYDKLLTDRTTPPIPTTPQFCGQHYHCEHKPTCFTDFGPHFPKNMTLVEIIVGKTNWEISGNELTKWHLDNGYLDLKPHWSNTKVNRSFANEINLAVTTGPGGIVQICGVLRESLRHSIIRIEHDVVLPADKADYVPDESKRVTLHSPHDRHYELGECTELTNVKKGSHVIGIIGNTTLPDRISSVSMVITW